MTSNILELPKWFIADMWSPFPINPECLRGIENMHVLVDCQNTVAEHFFGEAGCDQLRREIVAILREIGVEGDRERMTGVPAIPGLLVMVNLEEEGEKVQLHVGAAVWICNDLPSGAKASDQPDHGWLGYSRCIKFPLPIPKGPGVSAICFQSAVLLIHDFVNNFLQHNPGREDGRDPDR